MHRYGQAYATCVCVCVCVCTRAHTHTHPPTRTSEASSFTRKRISDFILLLYFRFSFPSVSSVYRQKLRAPSSRVLHNFRYFACTFFFFATGETLLEHHPRVCCTISELHHKNVCGAPSTPGEGKRESGRAGEEIGHEGVVCV